MEKLSELIKFKSQNNNIIDQNNNIIDQIKNIIDQIKNIIDQNNNIFDQNNYIINQIKVSRVPLSIGHCHLCMEGHLKLRLQSL